MNFKSLSIGIRNVLATRGITYKEVAAHLKMSESGVKKMLTGEDIGYNKLIAILDILDLKLEDLVSISPKAYTKLTKGQEEFFEKHPKHFNFLMQLHHFDMNPQLVKKANKLSKEKCDKFLEDLDDIKVIQRSGEVIHSLLSEGFSTSDQFHQKLQNQNHIFFKKMTAQDKKIWKSWMFEGTGTFTLSQKSALELRNSLKGLLDEFSARSTREKKIFPAEELIHSGALLVNIPLKVQELFPVL